MLHICKMDYIKDSSREYRRRQHGPGVVTEKVTPDPPATWEKGFRTSRLRPFHPSNTCANSFNPLRTQPCLWFPPKPLNLMHPPREIEFTVEPPFVAFPSLLPLSYPPDQRALWSQSVSPQQAALTQLCCLTPGQPCSSEWPLPPLLDAQKAFQMY